MEGLIICFGLALGSFLNCISERSVNEESFIKGRSYCPHCHHKLEVFDLIPVLSWLSLKGKCRYCNSKISIRYPLTEIIMAILVYLIYIQKNTIEYKIYLLIFCSLLFVLSLVDADTYTIPDTCHILAIINYAFYHRLNLEGLISGISVSLIVFLLTYGLNILLKKECMGMGDIKLLFVMGCYLGFYLCIMALFMASIIGLVMIFFLKKKEIPFGPALSISTIILLLYGKEVMKWYFLMMW